MRRTRRCLCRLRLAPVTLALAPTPARSWCSHTRACHYYAGEPTPYAWPDINSHFGILDIAGFEKARTHWYRAWFAQPSPPELFILPHWDWDAATNSTIDVWVYSNADAVELVVNGASQGRQVMQRYSHVQWTVAYAPGSVQALAYVNGTAQPVAVAWRNTTGSPAALVASIKDGVGATLYAGCADVALVAVAVVDASGAVVPTAVNNVTFSVSGPATLAGTGNGDPACHTNDKSAMRPAYHGLVLAVIAGGTTPGSVTVTATSPGLTPSSVVIPVAAPDATVSSAWCHLEPTM